MKTDSLSSCMQMNVWSSEDVLCFVIYTCPFWDRGCARENFFLCLVSGREGSWAKAPRRAGRWAGALQGWWLTAGAYSTASPASPLPMSCPAVLCLPLVSGGAIKLHGLENQMDRYSSYFSPLSSNIKKGKVTVVLKSIRFLDPQVIIFFHTFKTCWDPTAEFQCTHMQKCLLFCTLFIKMEMRLSLTFRECQDQGSEWLLASWTQTLAPISWQLTGAEFSARHKE